MRLNDEQRDLLAELTVTDAWPVLLKRIETIIENTGQQILKQDFKDDRDLALAKARYEGARALAIQIESIKEQLREKRPSHRTGRK